MKSALKKQNSGVFHLNENDAEFERYLSLIHILKGHEEYTLDAEGIIVSSNLEATNITGYEEWEVIGKKISMFYTIEDQLTGKPSEDLSKAAKRGYITFTSLWTKKRNSYFLARIKIKALSEHGMPVGYKLTLQDATHRAVTNHRIKKIKDEYLSLFNNSFVGIIKFTLQDYDIFMMNEKAERIFSSGMDRNKIKFDEIFEHPGDFSILVKKLLDQKKVEDFQFLQKGGLKWLMVSLRYFPSEKFAEGTIIDITDVKKKDWEIVRLNNELDQFIYHASHELRSPLSSLLGLVNLIKLDKDRNRTMEYVGFLEQKVNQLDELLTNIVAIGYNNKRSLSSDALDWHEVVEGCARSAMKNGNVKIYSQIDHSEPFENDIDRIKIILRNLISNGIKYFNPNLEEPWVRITISSDSSQARITIADNGVGIDEKHLKKVFEMFYKAHTYDGNGLGLYIVQVMVQRLGGKVEVESTLGSGSVFTITIPNLAQPSPQML